jgi:hypothetical protein
MDAARRLSLTAGVTAVAVAAYNPLATVLVQRADPSTHPLPVPVFAALTVVTVLGGVWYLVRDRVQPRVPLLAAHPVAIQIPYGQGPAHVKDPFRGIIDLIESDDEGNLIIAELKPPAVFGEMNLLLDPEAIVTRPGTSTPPAMATMRTALCRRLARAAL